MLENMHMPLRAFVTWSAGINAAFRPVQAAVGLALGLAIFAASALAQGCHFDPNNPVCIPDDTPGLAGRPQPVHWAAIAIVGSSLSVGASHGRNSEAEA